MPTPSPFPLNIISKVDSPELVAALAQFGRDKYLNAEDIELIIQALNYLNENLSEIPEATPVASTTVSGTVKVDIDTPDPHVYTKEFIDASSIVITTSVSIDTITTDSNNYGQHGRNVTINNGASAINITTHISSESNFVASYVKHGASAITFVQGAGTTLIQVDGTAVLNGAVGSTATLTRINNTFYLRVSNV